ncbi:MAG: hypothetical protein E7368_02720 [Clostridiales bacterium]|nr:hypothetical protein [Clostridiales bacterium]
MTKFDVYVENLSRAREERRNEKYNARLTNSLLTRTHEEVVAELMQGLTVILGVGDVQKAKTLVL